MKPCFKKIGRDAQGGILVEAALLFPLLMVVFFGMVEIAQFLDVVQRLNTLVNQTAMVIGGSPVLKGLSGPGSENSIDRAMPSMQYAADVAAQPHRITLSAVPCNWPSDAQWSSNGSTPNPYIHQPTGGNICGFGTGVSAGSVTASCAGASAAIATVSVTASCTYQPLFNLLGLIRFGTMSKGFVVSRNTNVPMQKLN